MKTPRLTVLEKIGFGGGDVAVNVVWSSLALILTFFYTDIFGLKASDIALLMLLPRLIDAFADVAMGMYTDKYITRWGRYRPYLLLLAVPFGLSVMLVYTTPELSYSGKLFWAYATYTLMMLVFTAVTIPYISLLGVLTADPQERLSANGYRLFFAKVAALMVTTFVPLFAAQLGRKPHRPGIPDLDGGDGGNGNAAVHVLLLHDDGTCQTQKWTTNPCGCNCNSFSKMINGWFWRPFALSAPLATSSGAPWRFIMRNTTFTATCMPVRARCRNSSRRIPCSANGAAPPPAMPSAVQFLTTGVVGSILAMVASTWITKRFCKVQLFRGSSSPRPCSAPFFILRSNPAKSCRPLSSISCFVLWLTCRGPCFGPSLPRPWIMVEVKSGKRVAGMAFGGISFCQKMGMSLGGGLVGWLLTYYHYVADQVQSAFTLNGIALLLSVIPGFFHLAMGFLMFNTLSPTNFTTR